MDPHKVLELQKKAPNARVYQSFGCEDAVYNHLHMLIECDKGKHQEI